MDLPETLRATIHQMYRKKERDVISYLCEKALLEPAQQADIKIRATELVKAVRIGRKKSTGIDSFLTEYALSSEEGIALMCLSEALLRVPDDLTMDRLIKDKLLNKDWESHKGRSDSFFVNAMTWALMLTGKILSPENAERCATHALKKLLNRSSEAIVRTSIEKAMRIIGKQFVMGRTINEALARARKKEMAGYRYSYDMLGEAALTAHDANRYFHAYKNAIEFIGTQSNTPADIYLRPGISIKLSALHPRYEESQHERVMNELAPKLLALAQLAKNFSMSLTIDAEESERLELSLDLIETVFCSEHLDNWNGFGIAVQSYQKRAFVLLDWIAALARLKKRRIMVRLIKGAYWDSEIKKTQMLGLSEYPVFTRKVFTDVSFQACAKKILTMTDAIYPQFATHNAYTVAMILNIAGSYRDFEFQCLHGMGTELYERIVPKEQEGIPCRIYAPLGSHEDLLPYLARRLLENGANSSFVNRIVDDKAPISDLIQDPVAKALSLFDTINKNIPLPEALFFPKRNNSKGLDFSDRYTNHHLQHELLEMAAKQWNAGPILEGKSHDWHLALNPVTCPQDNQKIIGFVQNATLEDVEYALQHGTLALPIWSNIPVEARVLPIYRFAELLEIHTTELMALLCLEAGKTWNDSIGEIREAIDFCRYYAVIATEMMETPQKLTGYTGELNELYWHPQGLVLSISPWNFPLSIFTGQIVAGLVTGNCVIAKPAEQTPLIAAFVVNLMHQAGIPAGAIQLLPGSGESIGSALVSDTRIQAVLFTGSSETARMINQTLSHRSGAIIPLIAETGGQNAMIVDSSALLEQVVMDVITSAFGSAGQRCSALRVLYLQEEIYNKTLELLIGALEEEVIGDPIWLSTDIGPVIDKEALLQLQKHIDMMAQQYKVIHQCSLANVLSGYFIPPTIIAIDSISSLTHEVFGPILHVISYKKNHLDKVITEINATHYGLTLGIHSRINYTIEYIKKRVSVGNCYVNRNMVGAVVGVQPFGGVGLSGTGPKAGGPHYLSRLCQERSYTVNTAAAGGNAHLMSLPADL